MGVYELFILVGRNPCGFDIAKYIDNMTNIRRYFDQGDIVFITSVTYKRIPILIENIDLLREAIQFVKTKFPVEFIASVVLPDHFHWLIDGKGQNIPYVVKRIKLKFSGQVRSRYKMKSGRLWQYRYWDRIMRGRKEMNNHIDYIHYNPVKHRLVASPFDWTYSTIDKYKKIYSEDWGRNELTFDGEFGE